MPDDINYYQRLADKIIEENKERDGLFDDIHEADTLEFELPQDAKNRIEGLRTEQSIEAHNALNTASRVFARVTPSPSYMPFTPNPETRKKADEIEYAVKYWYWMASRRTSPSVTRDLTRHSAKYAVNAIFVEHVEWMGQAEGASDEEIARRLEGGPFSLNVYNPRNVYPMRDRYGLKGVLVRTRRYAHEVISEYRGSSQRLIERMNDAEDEFDLVDLYEYWDTEYRATWVVPAPAGLSQASSFSDIALVRPVKHGLGFLPWVYESDPIPLLYAAVKSGNLKTTNLLLSLLTTESIGRFAETTEVIQENVAGNVELPLGEIGEPARVGPGEDVRRIPRSQIDGGMINLLEFFGGQIEASTLSNVLKGGPIPAQIAFPTLRLKINTDMNALAPYMEITENALAGIYTRMLQWVKFVDEPMVVMGLNDKNRGKQYTVDPDEIPDNFAHFTGKLHSSEPTDQQSRVNTALAAISLGLSKNRALEQIGVTDPETSMEERNQEMFDEAAIQLKIQEMQAQQQMDIQAMMAGFSNALQVLAQAAQMQSQAAQMTPQQAGGGFPGMPQGAPPPADPTGQFNPPLPSLNPAEGDVSPVVANPEAFLGQDDEDGIPAEAAGTESL